jgi:hypothetical protein
MDNIWKNAAIRYNSDILYRAEIHRKADQGDKVAHAILSIIASNLKK